jgi:hypothetical protein
MAVASIELAQNLHTLAERFEVMKDIAIAGPPLAAAEFHNLGLMFVDIATRIHELSELTGRAFELCGL